MYFLSNIMGMRAILRANNDKPFSIGYARVMHGISQDYVRLFMKHMGLSSNHRKVITICLMLLGSHGNVPPRNIRTKIYTRLPPKKRTSRLDSRSLGCDSAWRHHSVLCGCMPCVWYQRSWLWMGTIQPARIRHTP